MAGKTNRLKSCGKKYVPRAVQFKNTSIRPFDVGLVEDIQQTARRQCAAGRQSTAISLRVSQI